MPETILITSGKGGVGKSTVCTMVGTALARQGSRVLMLETDCGLRSLDVMNGAEERAIYDLADVLMGRCEPIRAIVPSSMAQGLFLLPAPNRHTYIPEHSGLEKLLQGLEEYYDFVLVDCPAGFGRIMEEVLMVAKKGIVVTLPNFICSRDAAKAGDLLEEAGIPGRLVINMLPKRFVPTDTVPDLDAVIDLTGLQLLGVVPEDEGMNQALNTGRPCWGCPASQAFEDMALRLRGKEVPLRIC